ncbi:class I tRNA ligase family protein [Candidatus Nomurabacteria bacterium]|nr:class I tRNA ligase family protein [Candidatus Nomurabacteria bacterium]
MTWRFFEKGGFNYDGEGILINSGRFDGLDSELAKNQIINFVDGKEKVSFKLRDWIFSRQRYWGEPIPVVFCDKCGIVPVPDKDLPVELPKVKNYQPTESGESPLANVFKWVNTKCPKCKGRARRETDTMPNWAGSSWYYLRYTDHKNSKSFADKKNLKYWTPVDWYNGGNEHTTLHLLYSRFWHKFLYDLDLVPTIEPYMKRTSHGMILGGGGVKMSKSLGNVINPDDVVKTFGADTLRLYEMFMGPFDQKIAWSDEAIVGPRRFLEKVWKISYKLQKNSAHSSLLGVPSGSHVDQNFSGVFQELNKNSLAGRFQPVAGGMAKNFYLVLLHKTIKKVEEDIMSMRFNTAISSMMILATEMEKSQYVDKEDFKKFLQILAPFAPHIAEELWNELGEKKSINLSTWPAWNPDLLKDEEVKIVIQVNGKVRAEILVPSDALEEDIKNKAIADPMVLKYTKGEKPSKIIYIKNKLINIVI